MPLMLRVVNILLASVLLAPLLFGGFVHAEESGAIVPLFNEVKVRFDSSNPLDVDEYIEIVNPFTEAIDLNRYVIEYFNTTNPSASQQPTQKPIADGLLGPGSSVVLAKNLDQIEDALQSPFSSLTDTGGRLHPLLFTSATQAQHFVRLTVYRVLVDNWTAREVMYW